jgi:PAS domain S-box-containing protein
MKKKSATPPDAAELRRHAKAKLIERNKKATAPPTTTADTRRLIHELEVHKIELEMQNEELVRARSEVKGLLRQYTDLNDFAPAGYFTLARDGVIHQVNLAGANLLGVERGTLINRRFGVFVSARSRTIFNIFLEKVFGSQQKEACEVALKKDGADPHWVHIEAITEERQECRVVIVDITERKRLSLQIEEERNRLASLLSSIPDEVWFADTHKKFTLVNPSAIQEFGLRSMDNIDVEKFAKSFEVLRSDGSPRPVEEAPHLRALAGEVVKNLEEIVRISNRQELRYRQVNAAPVRNTAGSIIGSICVVRDITDRKRAEETLKEAVANLIRAQRIAHIGNWNDYLETNQLSWSEEMYRIFGFPPNTPMNLAEATRVFQPEELERFLKAIGAAINADIPYSMDYKINRPDGVVRYIHEEGEVVRDEQGKAIWMHGTTQDITERKRTEEVLRQSEEKYRGIFENIQDVYYEATIEGTILEVSPSIAVMSKGQYRRDDLIGKLMWDFYADIGERQALLGVLRERGRVTDFIITLKNRDGSLIPCSISSKLLLDDQGRPEKIIGSMHDVTERKRAEKALRESEERYRSLYVDSRDAIMILSPDRGFISGNPTTIRMFTCRDEHDFTAHTPTSLSPEYQPDGSASTDKSQQMMRLAMEKGSHFFEWTYRRTDGTDFPAMVLLSRLESGGTQLLQATVRDISEFKRVEEQIQKDMREKEVMLKEIHHRVKNNMQVIISLLNLQSAGIHDPGVLAMLEESQNRIFSMALVHEMLYDSENLSRIDFGRYLAKLINNLEEAYKTDQHRVVFEIDANEVELSIEYAVPCGLIVQEIISNAFKHAFPKGWQGVPQIRIQLKSTGKTVELTIKDNGIGIPEGLELGKTQSLGLTLIHLLGKDQLGGEVSLDRREKGTAFRIRFKVE